MDIRLVLVTFSDIRDAVQHHLAALPSRIDAFLEHHILESRHYQIIIAGEVAGFASIHHERLITQFVLTDQYKRYGQPCFHQVRRHEQVQAAFVPTCDEFFLTHALDEYRQLAKQAYFFTVSRPVDDLQLPNTYALRVAEPGDITFIQEHAGDFFTPVDKYIDAHALFLIQVGDAFAGFGLLETSTLYPDVASIGMYTIEVFRRRGVATATIRLLIAECGRRSLSAVAGCWYYNHASKKTLERAGMFSQTRLLKIDY